MSASAVLDRQHDLGAGRLQLGMSLLEIRYQEPGHRMGEVLVDADQSHLHRHFKRSLGLTPGEYRRRLSEVP